MLEAFVHGKLASEQENMEDVLTSCVFGSLRLIPPHAGVLPFLALAQRWNGEASELVQLGSLDGLTLSDLDYTFWPMFGYPDRHRCEPDVLLRVKPTNQLILIEAKLFSGKSSEADDGPWPYDQLAREWDNLLCAASGETPILVYLTADSSMPRQQIEDSIAEFQTKRPTAPPPNIYWLSWQHLERLPLDEAGVLESLSKVLMRLDIHAFSGWSELRPLPPYRFTAAPADFRWDVLDVESPVTSEYKVRLTDSFGG